MAVGLMDIKGQYNELQGRIETSVLDVLRSGRVILGPNVKSFEEESAAYMGTADNDAQLDGTYDVPQQTAVAGLSAVVVTVGGAPGAGVCQVLVFYVVPVT